MNSESGKPGSHDEPPEEDMLNAYGAVQARSDNVSALLSGQAKQTFFAWHHPVKQIVRSRQWVALTERLIRSRPQGKSKLRYFTLPGPDLLDVRLLADACAPLNVKIEYFGFDAGAEAPPFSGGDEAFPSGMRVNAESALRQAGRITDNSVILPDRLEDIAIERSNASGQLEQRGAFDVINIDACDHFAYRPEGRSHDIFDALGALLKHQMISKTEWLLFITTRADPQFLGNPGLFLQAAVNQNLQTSQGFRDSLAACLDADATKLATAVASAWTMHGFSFLKLYSIGLGKYLLQFFQKQINCPADVELASCCAYSVHNGKPDMLALAFRIKPEGIRVMPAPVPDLEPARGIKIAAKASRIQDLDNEIAVNSTVRRNAVDGTKALLLSAGYDISAWMDWIRTHKSRPLSADETG